MEDRNAWPLIIGHRGASAFAPENTLAAFRLAIDVGADGIEFDVRLARDGVPVVVHDATLARTGRIRAAVGDLTSTELAGIDVGTWFKGPNGVNYSSERIPTLSKTLDILRDFPGTLFIELKCDGEDTEPLTAAVCEVIKNSPLASRIILKSFSLSVIQHTRARAPLIRTAALFAPKIRTILRKERQLINIAKEVNADELSIHYSLATNNLIELARANALPVNIWTVNNLTWLKRSLRLGIRSIITNDPARFISRRNEMPAFKTS
ncbi:MAG: glycerophosphodiester phosphodiesterase [Pyrinomonadaceae bacterium]